MEAAGVKLVVEGGDAFSSQLRDAGQAVESFNGVGAGLARGLGMVATGGAAVAAALGVTVVAAVGAAAASGFELNNAMEQASAKINAFTKDSGETAAILEMVRQRAAETPFAFGEMASAAAALVPVVKSTGEPLETLMEQAEILAALNPAEGLEGATFALREAMSGDFVSVMERFNIPRELINRLKEEGVPNAQIVSRALQEMGADYDLVSSLAQTFEGRMSTFKDTLQGVAAAATAPIFSAFSAGLGTVIERLQPMLPALEQAGQALGEMLAPAAQWAAEALGNLVVWSAQLFVDVVAGLQALVTWWQSGMTELGAAGETGLGGIMTMLGELGSKLLEWGLEMAGKLWQWLVESAPVLIGNLANLGATFISWIADQVPIWLAQMSALGQTLWQWILNAAPRAMDALIGFGANILDWAISMAPNVMSAVSNMRDAIVRWVVDALPQLGTNLGKLTAVLLAKLGEWISIAGPKLLELAGLFLAWVFTDVLPNMPAKLAEIGAALLRGIGNFISEVSPEIGKLAQKFLTWVSEDVLPELPGKLAKIGSEIVAGIGNFIGEVVAKAKEVGKKIIDGVIEGARNMIGSIKSALSDIVQKGLDAAKNVLGIKSPSRVAAEEIGMPIASGVALGILAAIDEVRQAVGTLSDETLRALEQLAGQAQRIMRDMLSGSIGAGRAQIGTIDWIAQQEQRVRDLYKKADDLDLAAQRRAEQAAAEQQQDAEKLLALQSRLADAEITAQQHHDPEQRRRAEEQVAAIRAEIAQQQRQAAERQARAAEEQRAAVNAAQEARRRADSAAGPMEQARNLLEEAQQVANRLAQTDPQSARDYLALRQKQITEFAALQEARLNAETARERDLIDQRMELLHQIHTQELAQFEAQARERAAGYAQLGQQAGNQLTDALRQSVQRGGQQIADALMQSIIAALRSTPGAPIAPIASPAATSNTTTMVGGPTITINGASMSIQSLEQMIRRVLGKQAQAAAQIGRVA